MVNYQKNPVLWNGIFCLWVWTHISFDMS